MENGQKLTIGQESTGEKVYDIFRSPISCQPKNQRKRTPKRKYDENSDKNRPRTPSGQVIGVSVENLKALIEKRSESRKQSGLAPPSENK